MKKLFFVATAAIMLNLCSCTQKWEYKTLTIKGSQTEMLSDFFPNSLTVTEASLNELGQEGWELVGTYTETETVHPNFGNSDYVTGIQPNVRTSSLTMIFKREL